MEGNTKNELIEDVENFLHSEEWYQHRAIPYRRGYMLYGPPGTGKNQFCHGNCWTLAKRYLHT